MQTIRLSTTPGVVNPGAYLSQYDVGRQMLFLLYDDVGKYIPAAGSTVHILGTKPSGFGFDVACTWSQNSVTVTVTDEMSNESGSFGAELRIEKNGDILGTANFLWNVERSTHPDGTVDGNTEAKGLMEAIEAAIEDAENAAAAANAAAGTAGLSLEFKQALLGCFENVAWVHDNGQTYYSALYDALFPPNPATAITLNKSTLSMHELNMEETLVATVTPADTTDATHWSSSNTSVATVDAFGKVKAIAYGSATITAQAGSVSATCSVTVPQLSSIDAVFTQGGTTIYENDSLDVLKPLLVVTATYSDSTTEVIPSTDYTLSGTLTEGTSTITATYEGKTDTFSVTVSAYVPHYTVVNNLTHTSNSNASTTSVEQGDSYSASIGVEIGYTLDSVTVMMGGVDVTSTAYNSGTQSISIASVTGNIVITAVAIMTPSSITAVFNQGANVIYDTDTLSDLIQYLTVTANYPDTTTATVPSTDYTLSGSLTVGTSTITVSYLNLTTTFTVTVTEYVDPRTLLYNWDLTSSLTDTVGSVTATLGAASGKSNPTQSASGLTFNDATQNIYFGSYDLTGKDVEIDVSSFSFSGLLNYHIRFFVMSNNALSSGSGLGPMIFRSGNGWNGYGSTAATGSTKSWYSDNWITGTSSDVMNAFSGKTVKLKFGSDGKTVDFYLDNTLIGSKNTHYHSNSDFRHFFIGGANSKNQSQGDQCYNMTITGVRIYSNS